MSHNSNLNSTEDSEKDDSSILRVKEDAPCGLLRQRPLRNALSLNSITLQEVHRSKSFGASRLESDPIKDNSTSSSNRYVDEYENTLANSERMKNAEHQFLKHFPDIKAPMQQYYYCAYSGRILFHGVLFITSSHFCFYSKMMPKKTITIKLSDIIDISKTKTVKLVPNAVGVLTINGKYYIFGSLISRNSTYKYMDFLWKMKEKNLESSMSGSNLTKDSPSNGDGSENSFDSIKEEDNNNNNNENNNESFKSDRNGDKDDCSVFDSRDIKDDDFPNHVSIIRLILSKPTLTFTSIIIILLICFSIVLTMKIFGIQKIMQSYINDINDQNHLHTSKGTNEDISKVLLEQINKFYLIMESNIQTMNETMKSLLKIKTDIDNAL